jgi:hypothetical protein
VVGPGPSGTQRHLQHGHALADPVRSAADYLSEVSGLNMSAQIVGDLTVHRVCRRPSPVTDGPLVRLILSIPTIPVTSLDFTGMSG